MCSYQVNLYRVSWSQVTPGCVPLLHASNAHPSLDTQCRMGCSICQRQRHRLQAELRLLSRQTHGNDEQMLACWPAKDIATAHA